MFNRSVSALTLLAVAGLASSLMACSKEEEKKAGWNCRAQDVPQGEVLRCTSAALTEDGTANPVNLTTDGYAGNTATGGAGGSGSGTQLVGTDGTSNTGTATGGTGSTTGTAGSGTSLGSDSTTAIGAGSGYGAGTYVPGTTGTSITSDATTAVGVITYDCFPGDTNPDCPPADSYDGMNTGGSGGTSTGASLNTDGTASTGDGTGTGTGGGAGSTTGTGGTQGTSDSTAATGDGTATGGGAGSTTGTGSTGSGTGGGTGGSTAGTSVTTDGTASTGNGNGNGGGGGINKYPGPDECAYVPDLSYCANGSAGTSTDGTPGSGGAAGGATASTPEGATTSGTTDGTGTKGNGNGGTGGNGSKSGTGGTTGTGGTGGTTGTGTGDGTGGGGTTTGTTDGTASAGPTGGGSGSATGGGSSTTGGGSSGSSKPTGKHYKCVKDGAGNKSCESIPDCPTGSVPSNGSCIDAGGSSASGSSASGSTAGSPTGGTTDGTGTTGTTGTDGKTPPSGSSTPGSSEVLRPSEGGCWVTGGGFIVSKNNLTGAPADGHDNYGGNAKPMKDGRIQGHWNHVDHGTKNHAKGKPEYIVCRKIANEPGPAQPGCKKGYCMNQVYFGGHAEWRDHAKGVWESGYWFDVVAKDHGEPGSQPHAKNEGFPDTYHFTIRKIDDPANNASGTVVYEVGRDSVIGGDGIIVGGNIQIHPPNNGHPYTAMTLPSWVKFENPAQ